MCYRSKGHDTGDEDGMHHRTLEQSGDGKERVTKI